MTFASCIYCGTDIRKQGLLCAVCTDDRRLGLRPHKATDKFDENDGQFNYVVIDTVTKQVVQNGIYYLGNTVIIRAHPPGSYTLRCRAVDYLSVEFNLTLSEGLSTKVLPVWIKDSLYITP